MNRISEIAVKDYLDAVVAVKVSELKIREFEGIKLLVSPDCVHVHCGIACMAEAAGCELKEELHPDWDGFPFEYFFEYKGIRFFQLEERRKNGYEDV